jgi:hypothetical protein
VGRFLVDVRVDFTDPNGPTLVVGGISGVPDDPLESDD